MARPKKSLLRQLGREALEEQGYETAVKRGQGLLPGARLIARKDGEDFVVAVRTSHERVLSFTMQTNSQWRTLENVDLVLAVVPAAKNSEIVEVLAFDSTALKARFDIASKGLERVDRSSSFEMPIFIPIDKESRKNVGHSVSNLKEIALWSVNVSAAAMKVKASDDRAGTFIDRVKREFAERNEVDVSKVVVEFRILT
ncbi:hypothetical protein [Bradyrhizobium erythrophlei]|nr:hypothetical protein [Bradyrhizobium erythrophlei]